MKATAWFYGSSFHNSRGGFATPPNRKFEVNPDYAQAACEILKTEAAVRYLAGDMTATDEAGHEAIEARVVEIVRARLEEK